MVIVIARTPICGATSKSYARLRIFDTNRNSMVHLLTISSVINQFPFMGSARKKFSYSNAPASFEQIFTG